MTATLKPLKRLTPKLFAKKQNSQKSKTMVQRCMCKRLSTACDRSRSKHYICVLCQSTFITSYSHSQEIRTIHFPTIHIAIVFDTSPEQ